MRETEERGGGGGRVTLLRMSVTALSEKAVSSDSRAVKEAMEVVEQSSRYLFLAYEDMASSSPSSKSSIAPSTFPFFDAPCEVRGGSIVRTEGAPSMGT
jgi:hypothetical protein